MDPKQTPPAPQPAANPTPPQTSRFAEIKNIVVKTLIGCLVAAAAVSVIAVLTGGFTDTLTKALLTLGSVAIHAIVALGYIKTSDSEPEELKIFSNTVFTITAFSFITSVFGIWSIFSGDLVGKLYETYFIVLFAVLHGEMLAKTRGKAPHVDQIVTTNYGFMGAVVIMLLLLVFIGFDSFGSIYYRFLAALGIIDATLTILAVALDRLYLNKHPELAPPPKVPGQKKRSRGMSILLILLGVYLVFQLIVSVVFGALGHFSF